MVGRSASGASSGSGRAARGGGKPGSRAVQTQPYPEPFIHCGGPRILAEHGPDPGSESASTRTEGCLAVARRATNAVPDVVARALAGSGPFRTEPLVGYEFALVAWEYKIGYKRHVDKTTRARLSGDHRTD